MSFFFKESETDLSWFSVLTRNTSFISALNKDTAFHKNEFFFSFKLCMESTDPTDTR